MPPDPLCRRTGILFVCLGRLALRLLGAQRLLDQGICVRGTRHG